MEQTPHGENPFKGEAAVSASFKNKPMLFGVIALIIIAAGVIWYISDTSKSTPATTLPPQATESTSTEPAMVEVPLANTADLPAVEESLSSMDANLKTLDDLKDI
ncbi:MAG TPA: hypothetical protein VJ579_02110 [Candidatus Paceibacterota bacterium]|nr:hypothetical protein [Candidatus Paceibacterota bacterium]